MDVLTAPSPPAAAEREPGAARGRARERAIVAALIGLAAAFLLATIRAGHVWEDDFALYISHARNILTGRPYGATGYLYNPAAPFGGPRTYPPVFPLLLLPVIKVFGLGLYAMKVEVVAFFAASLGLVHAHARRHFSFAVSASAIAILGFAPFFWDFKDTVLSDIPFLFFVLASLLVVDRATRAEERPVRWGLLCAGAMTLAYGTRTIGLVLPAVLVITELVRRRRVTRLSAVALSAFAAAAGLLTVLIPGGGSYLDDLRLHSVRLVAVNAWRYVRALERIAFNGFSMPLADAFFAALAVLAIAGYASRLRRAAFSPAEAFVPLYALAVLAWPIYQDTRLLIPVIPFFVVYALAGVPVIMRLARRPPWTTAAAGALVLAFAVSYATLYPKLDFGPLKTGVETPATRLAFAAVEARTRPGDVVIFRRPKALALYTGRPSSGYAAGIPDAEQLGYLARIHASWLLASDLDPPYLAAFVSRNARVLRPVYEGPGYVLYRVTPR